MYESNDQSGFTLLEVLVAFSLLATLLAVIIQTQGESAFFLEKTRKDASVNNEVINELLRAERLYSKSEFTNSRGTFPSGHVLEGDQWEKSIQEESFMGFVPVKRLTYTITWDKTESSDGKKFQASIFGD